MRPQHEAVALPGFPTLDGYGAYADTVSENAPVRDSKREVLSAGAVNTLKMLERVERQLGAKHAAAYQIELQQAFSALRGTVADDLAKAVKMAWNSGVKHGVWKKEGECLQYEEVAEKVNELRHHLYQAHEELSAVKAELELLKDEHAYGEVSSLFNEVMTDTDIASELTLHSYETL